MTSLTAEQEDTVLIGAALRIQCVFRVARAKRERAARKVERKAAFAQQCEDDLAVSAAVTLQAAQRRKLAAARTEQLKHSGGVSGHAANANREPLLAVEPPSLHASVSANDKITDDEPLPETASSTQLQATPSHRQGSTVTFVRNSPGSPKVGSGSSGIMVSTDVTFAEVLKSGVYESSASFMGASVFGREGLTTAFALSSVASFAVLMRDDPEAGRQIKEWDPASLNPTLIHECASMVIQAKWRVHEARTKVMRLKRERAQARSKANEVELEEVSARAIQSNFRGHAVRANGPTRERKRPSSAGAPKNAPDAAASPPRPLTPNSAALKIQCRQRTVLAKHEVERRREQRKSEFSKEVEDSLLDDAARTIQATQRRHAEQRRFAERKQQHDGIPAASSSQQPPQPAATSTTAGPSTSHAPSKLRTTVAAAHIPAGSGHGLSAVFYSAMSALLERTTAPAERCMFWGVRALHTITMDIALEGASSEASDEPRLPNLEVSRWVQGPLGSVVPLTAKVSDVSRGGNGTSPRGRLPALQHTAGGSKSPAGSNEPSPNSSPPSKKQLAPINK